MAPPASFRRLLAFGLAAAALPAAGAAAEPVPLAQRIEQCATCHGPDGNSTTANIPSIAGQPEFFITDQLVYTREGVRPNAAMAPFVAALTDEEIVALAKHYAALPAKATGERPDPALVARGAALSGQLRCGTCHLPSLAGQEQIPRLARQRIDYLDKAMRELRDSKRPSADTNMAAAVFGLSDEDIRALAHYAASR